MQDAWRTYLELAMGLTEASRKKVKKVVKEAGRQGRRHRRAGPGADRRAGRDQLGQPGGAGQARPIRGGPGAGRGRPGHRRRGRRAHRPGARAGEAAPGAETRAEGGGRRRPPTARCAADDRHSRDEDGQADRGEEDGGEEDGGEGGHRATKADDQSTATKKASRPRRARPGRRPRRPRPTQATAQEDGGQEDHAPRRPAGQEDADARRQRTATARTDRGRAPAGGAVMTGPDEPRDRRSAHRPDALARAWPPSRDAPPAEQVAPLAEAHRVLRETLDSIGDV